MKEHDDKPGHLARRFQQIAAAVFHAEVENAGYDLTPVQYAALTAVRSNPGIDQATLAGLIAYDRTGQRSMASRDGGQEYLPREGRPSGVHNLLVRRQR